MNHDFLPLQCKSRPSNQVLKLHLEVSDKWFIRSHFDLIESVHLLYSIESALPT